MDNTGKCTFSVIFHVTDYKDKPYLTEMVAGVDAEVNDKQYFDQMVGIPSELKQKNKYI
jgi:hypothetical protein